VPCTLTPFTPSPAFLGHHPWRPFQCPSLSLAHPVAEVPLILAIAQASSLMSTATAHYGVRYYFSSYPIICNPSVVVDCAEGTLRQFAQQPAYGDHRVKVNRLTKIFITHMHGEIPPIHWLPGKFLKGLCQPIILWVLCPSSEVLWGCPNPTQKHHKSRYV
jgi:hypothetical protein